MRHIITLMHMLTRYIHTSERQQTHAGTTDAVIGTILNAAVASLS